VVIKQPGAITPELPSSNYSDLGHRSGSDRTGEGRTRCVHQTITPKLPTPTT
jgi:hypothetical protein